MSRPIIEVQNLSKKYRLGVVGATTLRDEILRWKRRFSGEPAQDKSEFWALRDVSFSVEPGEVVGVLGRNGAGKSTLLKLLSRITEPTSGKATLRGRVASLLEVGTGFHPDLTGRENVYLNGAILGMKRGEIASQFDAIVAFSEVEKFIDTPVKHYSSGMRVRLAFAVAAHLQAEILIVDEVLAVGDAEFQRKCMGKMQEVSSRSGRTILFVSHNLAAVETLCPRGMLLEGGALRHTGAIRDTIRVYLSGDRAPGADLSREEWAGRGRLRLRKVSLVSNGVEVGEAPAGTPVELRFAYLNPDAVETATFVFTVYSESGAAVTNVSTSLHDAKVALSAPEGVVTCAIPKLGLNQGRYRLAAAVLDGDGRSTDHVPAALWFTVAGSRFYKGANLPDARYGTMLTEHKWL